MILSRKVPRSGRPLRKLGMEAGKGLPGVRWWPCEHLARVPKDKVSCDRKQPDDLVLTTRGLQWATLHAGALAFLQKLSPAARPFCDLEETR